MTTPRQLHANRRNAQRSTGPKTPDGKSAAAQNSFKHGIYAAQSLFPGESQAEFDLHRDQTFAEFDPSGTIETHLVERIVVLSWGLKRANRVQIAAINSLHNSHRTSPVRGLDAILKPKNNDFPTLPDLELGDVTVKDLANSRVIDNLLMRERRIENSLFRTIAELERKQMIRKMDM